MHIPKLFPSVCLLVAVLIGGSFQHVSAQQIDVSLTRSGDSLILALIPDAPLAGALTNLQLGLTWLPGSPAPLSWHGSPATAPFVNLLPAGNVETTGGVRVQRYAGFGLINWPSGLWQANQPLRLGAWLAPGINDAYAIGEQPEVKALNGTYYAEWNGIDMTGQVFSLAGTVLDIDPARPDQPLWRFFPNPTSQTLQVEGSFAPDQPVSIWLYDLTGRRIWQHHRSAGESTGGFALDLPAVPAGMYRIRVQQGAKMAGEQLVIGLKE